MSGNNSNKDQASPLRDMMKDAYYKIVDRYHAYNSKEETRQQFIKRVSEELKVSPIIVNNILIEVSINESMPSRRTE